MKSLKKNWIFIGIALVSILLGVIAVLTAVKLRQETAVAPNAPESKPKAFEGTPVPACQAQFTITLEATPTPTPSPTPNSTPQPTPTPSPTPTATPVGGLQCGATCVTNADCSTGMTCFATGNSSVCRNSQCTSQVSCICLAASPTPTPTPSPTPNPSATPPAACGTTCASNTDCPSNMACLIASGATTGVCRLATCQSESSCVCTPAASTTPVPTPSTTPSVPVTGSVWPTIFLTIGGITLLVIGFAL